MAEKKTEKEKVATDISEEVEVKETEKEDTEEIVADEIGEMSEEDQPEVTRQDFEKKEQEIEESGVENVDPDLFMQETMILDSFAKRSVTLPESKKRLKQAFKDEEIIGDETGEIETYAKLKKKEYDILIDSAKSVKPKVLYGRIDGIEEVQMGSLKILEIVAHLAAAERNDLNTEREIKSNIYKIKIPAQMLGFYNHEKYDNPENFDSFKTMLNMRIKSIIEFVVYNVDPTEEDVLASSVTAKQLLQYDWYLGKRAKIKPGVKAKGHITYICSKGIIVNVMGAETFIKNSELRWGFCNNPLEEKENFYIGKSVPVRITSVKTSHCEILGKSYPYVSITGSIKDAMPNPNVINFEKYQRGQKYFGVIAYHLITGEYIVRLGAEKSGVNGDGVVCMCKPPAIEFGASPYIGQEVNVIILRKNEDKHTMVGAFSFMDKN